MNERSCTSRHRQAAAGKLLFMLSHGAPKLAGHMSELQVEKAADAVSSPSPPQLQLFRCLRLRCNSTTDSLALAGQRGLGEVVELQQL